MQRMNDVMDPTLKAQGLAGAYLAADGSSASGAPRDDEPERSGLALGDMFEMGLESLLMHFRRQPAGTVIRDGRSHAEPSAADQASDVTADLRSTEPDR